MWIEQNLYPYIICTLSYRYTLPYTLSLHHTSKVFYEVVGVMSGPLTGNQDQQNLYTRRESLKYLIYQI